MWVLIVSHIGHLFVWNGFILAFLFFYFNNLIGGEGGFDSSKSWTPSLETPENIS